MLEVTSIPQEMMKVCKGKVGVERDDSLNLFQLKYLPFANFTKHMPKQTHCLAPPKVTEGVHTYERPGNLSFTNLTMSPPLYVGLGNH